ncbi:hypothetical protein SynBIOSE41_02433 [Synechococcus sp. BIOS-E4-1]|uniref:hypothetical protein n=1 Tax=Synechococcus sp. BIOS-E4-1 TaxID=1400864 RepID=UPI001648CD57|nr:hypothetical protein [Synechococcus sp. BIOS-E4-1]QNI54932.1 hypothetical protein SynBIOSE41_02433 [Synechococcus sp. BIOS-E4-1]
MSDVVQSADNEEQVRDLAQQIAGMSKADKDKILWELVNAETFERIKEWSLAGINYFDHEIGINNYETGTADTKPVLGFLMAAAAMTKQSADSMARAEMQTMREASQYGSRIAESISDVANEIQGATQELIALHCAYNAVLCGRQRNVHYLDVDGNSEPFSDEERFRKTLRLEG